MTLAFMQQFPKELERIGGKPTHFIEKIWQGLSGELPDQLIETWLQSDGILDQELGNKFDLGYPNNFNPKLHTMRRDEKNRWKAGNDIHFVINNRTPQRFQFAPVIPCVSTQDVEIVWFDKGESDIPCSTYLIKEEQVGEEVIEWEIPIAIWIDNDKLLSINEVETLAINDGFDSVEDFFAYFNTDWSGTLIHWTNLKY